MAVAARKIWTMPDGLSDKAIEVFTDLEYAKYKLKVFEKQYDGLMGEIAKVNVALEQMSDMISNLRSKKSRIVSFKEFQKIQENIDHAKSLEHDWSVKMKKYQSDIVEIREKINDLQKLFDKIKDYGKVVKLADAKRKRSKDRV